MSSVTESIKENNTISLTDKNAKTQVFRLALFLGEAMLTNGAETYRIEDTIRRICCSRGYKYVNTFISPTAIIISDARFDGVTFLTSIKERQINLNKVSKLNDFSRKFVDDKTITIEDGLARVKEINNQGSPYSNLQKYLSAGVGCASFAYMIGGNTIFNFILTIFISILVCLIYEKLHKTTGISAFASLISSAIVTCIAGTATILGLIDSPTTIIVGSIMPLFCGVTFVKGVRDLVSGDLLSGISSITEACLISISLAVGVGFVLDLFVKLGGAL